MFGIINTIEDLYNKKYMVLNGAEHMALSIPIQGISADIIKIAMIRLYDEFKKNNQKINKTCIITWWNFTILSKGWIW